MDSKSSQADWKDMRFRRRAPSFVAKAFDTKRLESEDFVDTVVAQPTDSLPDRYRLRGEDQDRLGCVEAPTLEVLIQRGVVASASALKNARAGSIYLDGAASGPPEVDTERGVLNLDHHEGCVRPFTLSTCEQAFVLVRKGLDLESREWTIYANEPDLDALLAIWVLLNHRRIVQADPATLRPLVRLLRLEGAIDAHGLEHRHYCGFSQADEDLAFAELESLREREVELRKAGEWGSIGFAEYTADQLRAVDRLVFQEGDFEQLHPVEEIGRVNLGEGRMAIACTAEVGIYRVEEHLRAIYGDRLGLIVLQKDPRQYTLRQTGAFSRLLQRVYDRLNLIDGAAGSSQSGERWGGSAEIGGSPRQGGTALSLEQILEACQSACQPPAALSSFAAVGLATVVTGALSVLPWAIGTLPFNSHALGVAAGALGLLIATVLAFGELARRPGIAGLRRPVGWRWSLALPVAVLGAAAGGSWLGGSDVGLGWLALVMFPLAAELLFRGVGYGILLLRFAGLEGRYRFVPLVGSSILYALWTTVLSSGAAIQGNNGNSLLDLARAPLVSISGSSFGVLETLALVFFAALLLGLALGWARKSSESVLPPIALHLILALAAAWFVY